MISWPAAKIGCREGVDGIEMGTLKHLQFPTPEDPEELVVRQEREQLRRAFPQLYRAERADQNRWENFVNHLISAIALIFLFAIVVHQWL